jgi:hypothetical protein
MGKWMTPQTKLDSMRSSKKKLRVKYKTKMAQMMPIMMMGMMGMCLSSSVGAALMMGGEEETPTTTTTTPVGPSAPVLPSAQYVKIARPTGIYADETAILNIAEIEVFDKAGTNIALNATVTGGPGNHSAGPWANLTDGNFGNFAHTFGDGIAFMTIDLGAVKEIAKIVITNRAGYSGSKRMENATVKLLDASQVDVKTTEAIVGEKMKMTYDFDAATPAWEYADA